MEAPEDEISRDQPWMAARAVGDVALGDRGRRALPEPTPDYGIDKAIELMRQLPEDNIELVVQVVKTTLESLGIDVGSIIQDAALRQSDIQTRIGVLRKEIAGLETEIDTRRSEIGALDTEYREATLVKERLGMAEKSSGAEGAVKALPLDQPSATAPGSTVHPPDERAAPWWRDTDG